MKSDDEVNDAYSLSLLEGQFVADKEQLRRMGIPLLSRTPYKSGSITLCLNCLNIHNLRKQTKHICSTR